MADQTLDIDNLCRSSHDMPIWEALKAKNFKTAMQQVDKRIKKDSKSSTYLIALKTLITSRMPLISDKSLAITHIEELLDSNTTVTPLDAVQLYEVAFENTLPQSKKSWSRIVGELRWRFVKSNPKDEDASIECFKVCLLNEDLDHAVKIATSLDKNFPKKHEYVFWQITAMFLFSKSSNCPEKQKDVWSRLALGQIEKLAAATIQAGEGGEAPRLRSIQKPQEILLLHLIEEAHGRSQERLDYLKSPHLGPESPAAKEEWQLWIDRFNTMEQLEQWQALFEKTSGLLKRARTKDASGQLIESRYSDFVVWKHFNKSAKKLDQHAYTSQVFFELDAHLDPSSGIDKPWRRNAALIWLDLTINMGSTWSDGSGKAPSRTAAIITHLKNYGNTSVAYEDIRPHVEAVGFPECYQLLEVLLKSKFDLSNNTEDEFQEAGRDTLSPEYQDFTSPGKITMLVNIQKSLFLLASGIPEAQRLSFAARKVTCAVCLNPCSSFCDVCLARLARSSLQSYGRAIKDNDKITSTLLPTDRHPADDLSILSAMSLVKLSVSATDSSVTLSGANISYILGAALLLEYAWSQSKSNFQILLVLIKLYSKLGCGSLAMRAYQRLGVKQIQHNTLAHVMFNRISSLHPHSFTHNPDNPAELRSPLDQLKDQQKLYKNALLQTNKNLWKSFKLGSYNSVLGITEFSESLQRSVAKVMSIVESRKVSRLVAPNAPIGTSFDLLPSYFDDFELELFDSSDHASFPDFGATQNPRFRNFFGPLHADPCNERSQASIAAERLRIFVNAASESSHKKDALLIWLRNYLEMDAMKNRHQKQVAKAQHFTESERYSTRATDSLAKLLFTALESSQDAKLWNQHNTQLCEILEKQMQHVAGIQESEPAFQSSLHMLYTSYDLVTMVDEVMGYVWKLPGALKLRQNLDKGADSTAKSLREAIIAKSVKIKKSLDESGWMDKVLDSLTRQSGPVEEPSQESVVASLTEVVGENFMEEWAGHIVESWKDSVVGFSYFKST